MVVMLAGHYVLLNLFLAAIMKQMETLTIDDIEQRKVRVFKADRGPYQRLFKGLRRAS
jgi:hypothetical protein